MQGHQGHTTLKHQKDGNIVATVKTNENPPSQHAIDTEDEEDMDTVQTTDDETTTQNEPVTMATTTRSGRVVRKPERYKDYV